MIVGGIYLSKKVKKSIRQRQAQKAAERLSNPYDIVGDPSDEIKAKAPPSSPTLSRSSSRSRSASTSSPVSTFVSPASDTSRDKEWEAFTQRASVGGHVPEDPPTYEVAMSAISEGSTSPSKHEVLPYHSQRERSHADMSTWAFGRSRASASVGLSQSSQPAIPKPYFQGISEATIPRETTSLIETAPIAAELPAETHAIAELPTFPIDMVELPANDVAELGTDNEKLRLELPLENLYVGELEGSAVSETSAERTSLLIPVLELPAEDVDPGSSAGPAGSGPSAKPPD
jgi:hypothetical protein